MVLKSMVNKVALSTGIGFRALGQRISEIECHGRNLDHGQRKGLEMMGFKTKDIWRGFKSLSAVISTIAIEL